MKPFFVYIENKDETVAKKAVAVKNEKEARKRFSNETVVAVKPIEDMDINLDKIGEALVSGGLGKTEKEIVLDILSQSKIAEKNPS